MLLKPSNIYIRPAYHMYLSPGSRRQGAVSEQMLTGNKSTFILASKWPILSDWGKKGNPRPLYSTQSIVLNLLCSVQFRSSSTEKNIFQDLSLETATDRHGLPNTAKRMLTEVHKTKNLLGGSVADGIHWLQLWEVTIWGKKNERRDNDMKTPILMSSFLLQWRGARPPLISFPPHTSSWLLSGLLSAVIRQVHADWSLSFGHHRVPQCKWNNAVKG